MKAKSNNKLKITAIIMAAALIAVIGGLIGVYAATQQNVTSSFSVNYSIGKNVAVGLNAMAISGDDAPVWLESDYSIYDSDNDKGPIYKVSANDENRNLQFVLPEEYNGALSLKDYSGWYQCFMQFYIQNLSDKAIKATVTDNGIITDGLYTVYQVGEVSKVGVNDFDVSAPQINVTTIDIPAGKLYMFRLIISQNGTFNGNTSESYTSNAENGISFRFEQA